jgi:hypothetical protein
MVEVRLRGSTRSLQGCIIRPDDRFLKYTLRIAGQFIDIPHSGGTRWRSLLRHCGTSRKVGSIHDAVSGIFRLYNPSGRTLALGLAQPVIEMGKGDRRLGMTTLPPSFADCLEIWEPQPPGTLRACRGL